MIFLLFPWLLVWQSQRHWTGSGMDERTSTQAAHPTCIKQVKIEKLFGYLTYTIPEGRILGADADRLMILYGDNGSGKTTILTLIFCLLSPLRERGEKSYVARTPFRYFEILFDDGTTISAVKEGEQLTGSYSVVIRHPTAVEESYYLKANAQGNIAAPPSDEVVKLFEGLGKLGITLYFLPDDRRVRTTLRTTLDFEAKAHPNIVWATEDDEDHEPVVVSRIVARELADSDRGSHHLDIGPALENVEYWFRSHALQGSSAGEETATSIYLRVVEQIMALAGGAPAAEENYQTLSTGRFKDLQSKTDAFTRFGLITPFPADKFLNAFLTANDPAKRTIATVIEPYVDGLEARLAALDGIRNIILTYVETINDFLTGKEIEFSLQSGVTIRGYRKTALDPSMLSSGEKQLFLLLTNTILARDSVGIFLIDEPELSLNVKWQRRLISALLRCSQGSTIQYFLASHSLELITQHRSSAVRLSQVNEPSIYA